MLYQVFQDLIICVIKQYCIIHAKINSLNNFLIVFLFVSIGLACFKYNGQNHLFEPSLKLTEKKLYHFFIFLLSQNSKVEIKPTIYTFNLELRIVLKSKRYNNLVTAEYIISKTSPLREN